MARDSKYVDDYAKRAVVDEDGDYIKDIYVYIKPWYRLDMAPADKRRACIGLAAASAVILVVYVAIGFLNNPSSRVPYGLIPYILNLLPMMMLPASVYNMYTADELMTRKQRDRGIKRLGTYAMFALVCGGLAALGTVIYMATHRVSSGDLIYILGNTIIALGAYLCRRTQKNLPLVTQENENAPKDGGKQPEKEQQTTGLGKLIGKLKKKDK